MIRIVFIICSIFAVSFCQAQSAAAEHAEIFSVINRQVDGWNRGDLESFMQGYAQSDSLRFASGGSVTFGWENMLSRYKRRYTTRDSMGTLIFSGISVEMITSKAAMVFGTWTLQRKNDRPWGLFTLFFKKMNGEWRIVHDHTSSGN